MERCHSDFVLFLIVIVAAFAEVGSVNSDETAPKKADFVIVFDMSPLEWGFDPPETVYRPKNKTRQEIIDSGVYFRGWLVWLMWLLSVTDYDSMMTAVHVNLPANRVTQQMLFTYELYRYLHIHFEPADYDIIRHKARLHDAEKIVERVRNVINRTADRAGVPLLLIWHVPYKGPQEAVQNLTNTKNGPEVVVAFESYFGSKNAYFCITGKSPYSMVMEGDWEKLVRPYSKEILELVRQCKTMIDYSPCYYNDTLASARRCVEDSWYKAPPGTDKSIAKYCMSGIRATGAPCHVSDGPEECERLCNDALVEKCSAECGQGTKEWVLRYNATKYTKNCRKDPETCVGTKCPESGEPTQPPPTTIQMSRPVPISSVEPEPIVKGIVLEMWQIALIAVGGTTVLVGVIGVIICCARREKRRRKFPRGQRPPWYSFRERIPVQGRTHQPRGFPGRVRGRHQPVGYHGRSQDHNIRDQHPRSPARPSYVSMGKARTEGSGSATGKGRFTVSDRLMRNR